MPRGEGRRGRSKEERGGRSKEEEEEEEEEEETYVLQLAWIRFCEFEEIRENMSIFAVIKENVAAITPLGDFDMRPLDEVNLWFWDHDMNC